MADLEKLQKSLEAEGFAVSRFDTAVQAADYLDAVLDKKTIGIGGSVTIQEMALAERLGKHNQILWHWAGSTAQEAAGAQIYLTSVNGAAETGELINIDGTGNRVASGLFGHEKVYFIVGRNKVAPDYDAALWRARNIAAPKNAQRLGRKTPCAAKGDRCYDCKSPERICRALVVYWEKPNSMDMEVVLVDEDLGY
ncbi:lactate utilization protein [Intestinimonas butyriciproducens]|uniref:lactate utilization protein n=1 Tax=Intestinimonas butyriciproducens TaxID=1297617 RepID=UPI00195A1104|nr:lactate utilization protein [Intestinimonas butyriciproducens]MBM6977371.1 lactate utilization protein [Intestinimonas butyriciproducens]